MKKVLKITLYTLGLAIGSMIGTLIAGFQWGSSEFVYMVFGGFITGVFMTYFGLITLDKYLND